MVQREFFEGKVIVFGDDFKQILLGIDMILFMLQSMLLTFGIIVKF